MIILVLQYMADVTFMGEKTKFENQLTFPNRAVTPTNRYQGKMGFFLNFCKGKSFFSGEG
jgi:hypothetical protein